MTRIDSILCDKEATTADIVALPAGIGSAARDHGLVHLTYFWRHWRWLDLTDPRRFTELVQWRKLYDRDHRLPQLIDKVAVKIFVCERIGPAWITPTLWQARRCRIIRRGPRRLSSSRVTDATSGFSSGRRDRTGKRSDGFPHDGLIGPMAGGWRNGAIVTCRAVCWLNPSSALASAADRLQALRIRRSCGRHTGPPRSRARSSLGAARSLLARPIPPR
ncbi:hypothetical protein [Sphingomonas sp. 1P08PE]|uniref:hypothetical protein n=1 Tax=Sphingomonas sp. 1P08PE TaxID=554122 RepID=UPI0039A3C16A